MGQAGLQCLGRKLRIMQDAPRGDMGSLLRIKQGFKLRNACLERRRRIFGTVEDHNRHPAILHELVPGTGLIGALLRGGAPRALQAKGAAHLVFHGLRIAGGDW